MAESRKARSPAAKGPSQKDRFIEAARELECDDDKDAFEKRLGKIAKAKPDASKKPPRR